MGSNTISTGAIDAYQLAGDVCGALQGLVNTLGLPGKIST